MGWVSHLEYFWNEPHFARFLNRLASMARLILFDKRGTGLSDAVPVTELPTLEQRLDDVRAVMEAVGSERAVLLGVSEGGPMCSLFAATYPERTEALIMIGSYARRLRDADYPWGPTREERDAFCQRIVDEWGGPVGLEERAPSKIGDPAFREWWASYLRMGASPGAAVALTRMNAEIDIRGVLPSIQVPTLVLHRAGDRCLRIEEGQYLASHIRGATFVKLEGDDHLPFVGDQDAILNEIQSFIARTHARTPVGLVLASIVTIRSEARGSDLVHLRRVFERELAWGRGSQTLPPADSSSRRSMVPAVPSDARPPSSRLPGGPASSRARACTSANAICRTARDRSSISRPSSRMPPIRGTSTSRGPSSTSCTAQASNSPIAAR